MNKPKEGQTLEGQKSSILLDPRFSHLVKDPRFKALPKNDKKVKIDKRFQPMFRDEKFNVKYSVDKYGRPLKTTSSDDLKKYYDVQSTDEENEGHERELEEEAIVEINENDGKKKKKKPKNKLKKNVVFVSEDEEDTGTSKLSVIDDQVDYARGQGRMVTDSSEGEISNDDDAEELRIEHSWGELDQDAEITDESTRRLAVCNMDWDRIRADDIMVLCSSFLPPGGSINSVKIFLSEYGKKRLAEEEKNGPPELTKKDKKEKGKRKKKGYESDEEAVKEQGSDAEEGEEYDIEKLREYQLNRLKYYYAVVECDSVETADKIYQDCDGIEYESSATKVDLRFIPDETVFTDKPQDECTQLPEHGQYKPRQFTTAALQQANVDLTWDENSVERKELAEKLLSGKINEIKDSDLKKIVAYSSEEDEHEPDKPAKSDNKTANEQTTTTSKNPLDVYRDLLRQVNEEESKAKRSKVDKEITWNIEPEPKVEKSDKDSAKQKEKPPTKNDKKKTSENHSDDEVSDIYGLETEDEAPQPSTYQNFINSAKSKFKSGTKRKSIAEKKEDKKIDAELKLLMESDEGKKHFSLVKLIEEDNQSKSAKKKRAKLLKRLSKSANTSRQSMDDNFKINLNDERFKNVYVSPQYHIDPTNPQFKNTKGMQQIIEEKQKRQSSTPASIDSFKLLEKKPNAEKLQNRILVNNLKKKLDRLTRERD